MDSQPKRGSNRNIPNTITVGSFIPCLYLLWVVVTHRERIYTMLVLLAIVFVSDFLDGFLAKRWHEETSFGGAADRLRDKFLFGIMFLFLILDDRVHLSLKIVSAPSAIVEAMLLVIWFAGIYRKMDVSTVKPKIAPENPERMEKGLLPSIIRWLQGRGPGQIKMGLLSAAIMFCSINLIVEEEWGDRYHLWATWVINLIFIVSFPFALKSYIGHRKKYRAFLAQQALQNHK